MLRKRYVAALVCSAMLLVAGCDSDSRSPGITDGGNRLESMKPRAFIATMAMSALLNEDPTADVKVLSERSFEIADAMIEEAEKVDEDTSSE